MATDAMVVSGALAPRPDSSIPAVPWRDPHTVSPRDLAAYIGSLERRCLENPDSPELWTCLGMAYAVNHDVVKSMDALETATDVEPTHFWARLKYGELHYRLRALDTRGGRNPEGGGACRECASAVDGEKTTQRDPRVEPPAASGGTRRPPHGGGRCSCRRC